MASSNNTPDPISCADAELLKLYQHSQSSGSPKHLDQFILQQAEQAVSQQGVQSQPLATLGEKFKRMLWSGAPALAATLVIGVVALLLTQNQLKTPSMSAPLESTYSKSLDPQQDAVTPLPARSESRAFEESKSQNKGLKENAQEQNRALRKKSSDDAGFSSAPSSLADALETEAVLATPKAQEQSVLERRAASSPRAKASDSPREDLATIRAYINAQQIDKAQQALKQFVEKYPGYPLPEDLKPWAGDLQ